MKIEIHQMSNDPAYCMFRVYASNTREVAHIDDGGLAEVLTEAQWKRFENGDYQFNVREQDLMENSKRYFPHNK